jgi:hypothetical protein
MSQQRPRSTFFMAMALLLLFLVFLGFAPTFYLRPVFATIDEPTASRSLPGYLLLHGLAVSSWYLLFAVQAVMIRYRRVSLHRLIGWAGVVSACAVVVTGFVVLARVVPRRLVEGQPVPPELIEGAGPIILFQTWNLFCFLAVVMLAVWFRTRSWLHRRLMLIASIQIIGAALTTNRMFGAMLQSLSPDSISVPLLLGLLLAIALPVFDYVSARKVYAVSMIGTVILLAPIILVPLLQESSVATAWLRWLGNVP